MDKFDPKSSMVGRKKTLSIHYKKLSYTKICALIITLKGFRKLQLPPLLVNC